jgi:hypothetical protein
MRGWAKLATMPAPDRWSSFHIINRNNLSFRMGGGQIFAAMVFLTYRSRSVYSESEFKGVWG